MEAVAILVASFALAAVVVSHRPWGEYALGQLGPFAMPLAILVFAALQFVLRATPEAAGALGGMEQGWSESLDKLEDTLAR